VKTGTVADRKTARAAGLLYILVGITGAFGIAVVPKLLIVPGDPAATADRILGSEWMFRLGIAGELVNAVAFIFLVLTLQRLFKSTDERLASLMVIFVLVSIPISFANELNALAALGLLTVPDVSSAFDRHQVETLVSVFLRLHSLGFVVNSIFWGLWLLPLGLLVLRSVFAPRALGYLVILAGLAYVIPVFGSLLALSFHDIASSVAIVFEGVGEVSMVVWLLMFGARRSAVTRD
jgi:hypothetical protein